MFGNASLRSSQVEALTPKRPLQISSTNLLIAGAFGNRAAGAPQAGPTPQATRAQQASPAAQKAADDKFVPIDFKKAPAAPTPAGEPTTSSATSPPTAFQRPGSQLDIRV